MSRRARHLVLLAALALAPACTFDPSSPLAGGPGDAGPRDVDARVIDAPDVDPRVDGAGPADARPPDAATCPAGYSVEDLGCYRVVTTSSLWVPSERACEADGGHLIVIGSTAENDLAVRLLAGTRGWIGYTDREVRDFIWVTREPSVYANWSEGEPNNGDGWFDQEDCAEVTPAGTWNDQGCREARPSVCEHDGMPADPTTY